MLTVKSPVQKLIALENNIFLLQIHSPELAVCSSPGQFVNVKVTETIHPLLRRPFSICDIEGESIYLMFNIFGEGTKILASKNPGVLVDIIGPLGHGFNYKDGYDTAIIAAGGLGAAPFPFFTRRIKQENKKVLTFIGGRTKKDVITHGLDNVYTCSDDGSEGSKGNVVELMQENIKLIKSAGNVKIFACGPTAMLRALKEFSIKNSLDCEVSTECAMACGFGICQGCPIESTSNPDKYLLVCKDGPVFNVKDVVL